jgi:hypothetical protein
MKPSTFKLQGLLVRVSVRFSGSRNSTHVTVQTWRLIPPLWVHNHSHETPGKNHTAQRYLVFCFQLEQDKKHVSTSLRCLARQIKLYIYIKFFFSNFIDVTN